MGPKKLWFRRFFLHLYWPWRSNVTQAFQPVSRLKTQPGKAVTHFLGSRAPSRVEAGAPPTGSKSVPWHGASCPCAARFPRMGRMPHATSRTSPASRRPPHARARMLPGVAVGPSRDSSVGCLPVAERIPNLPRAGILTSPTEEEEARKTRDPVPVGRDERPARPVRGHARPRVPTKKRLIPFPATSGCLNGEGGRSVSFWLRRGEAGAAAGRGRFLRSRCARLFGACRRPVPGSCSFGTGGRWCPGGWLRSS